MKNTRWILIIFAAIALILVGVFTLSKSPSVNPKRVVGQPIDNLNGVHVYYNGGVGNVKGRNLAPDGYNYGLKYQCVEFVKRYYYKHLNHKMPDSYGHAKSFYLKNVGDGRKNTQRNLTQYTNPSNSKPMVNDLLVFGPTRFNKYGHVAIVSKVSNREIEIIQQNPGPLGSSRETFKLKSVNGKWKIENSYALGWLRKN